MIVRQIKSGDLTFFQGAIKVKTLKEKELQKKPFEVFNFTQIQYKGVDPREVDKIKRFLFDGIKYHREHFLGTITIGLLLEAKEIPFEPLQFENRQIKGSDTIGNFGILQIEEELLIPIDGLHRYYSIIQILRELPYNRRLEFEQEEVSVVLIPCSSLDQLQTLMLRLQKSVRADRGEEIRTGNHDNYALLARKLCGIDGKHEEAISEKMVNWKSNTLTTRLQKFTTLSVLYDSAKILYPDLGRKNLSADEFSSIYEEFAMIWRTLLQNFRLFRQAIKAEKTIPALRYRYICLRATGQLVVIQVINIAIQNEGIEALEKVINKLNNVSWKVDDPLWEKVLMKNGRLNAGEDAKNFASRLLAYQIGIPQSDKEVDDLKALYSRTKQQELSSPVYDVPELTRE
jgi:hypothetical protein